MRILLIGLITTIFLGVSAMAGGQDGETVKIRIRTEKKISKTGIKVRFIELLEDSRCPADVDCIQAGNARIKVEFSKNGRSMITELNTFSGIRGDQFAGYSIRLISLTPQPHTERPIEKDSYVAEFEAERLTR